MTEDDEARFDGLWADHAAAVLRYARAHVQPDDLEDVVAETFVVAWRRIAEVPEFGLPWLLGVARGVSGTEGHGYDVDSSPDPQLPAAAGACIGDRLTEVAGHPAVVSPVQGTEADGGPPGSAGLITLAMDVAPGAVAYSRFEPGDLG